MRLRKLGGVFDLLLRDILHAVCNVGADGSREQEGFLENGSN